MSQRHKHADLIHAWAEGAKIEIENCNGDWTEIAHPNFAQENNYRIKPKELKWWENIPGHGILVKGKKSNQVIAVYSTANTYEMWEPLTNEEIERFKR